MTPLRHAAPIYLAAALMPLSTSAAAPASSPSPELHASQINKRGAMGSTPFLDAILEGNTSLVARMIAAGADVNYLPSFSEEELAHGDNPYATPLIMACGGEIPPQAEIVKLLLAAGANPNLAMPESGWTALMTAASFARVQLVTLLLDAGADPNQRTAAGDSALARACDMQSVEIVEALLAAGADAKQLGEHRRNLYYHVLGASAILEAPPLDAVSARVVLIKKLHARGVDVNHVDAQGETPLMRLVRMSQIYGNEEESLALARCLMQLGARPRWKNSKGDSALSLAQQQGKKKLADCLATCRAAE